MKHFEKTVYFVGDVSFTLSEWIKANPNAIEVNHTVCLMAGGGYYISIMYRERTQ